MQLTKAGWAAVVGIGMLAAVVAFGLLTLGLQAYRDHLAVQAFDRILGYNLQRGRIELPPELAPGVPQAPQAPPAQKP